MIRALLDDEYRAQTARSFGSFADNLCLSRKKFDTTVTSFNRHSRLLTTQITGDSHTHHHQDSVALASMSSSNSGGHTDMNHCFVIGQAVEVKVTTLPWTEGTVVGLLPFEQIEVKLYGTDITVQVNPSQVRSTLEADPLVL